MMRAYILDGQHNVIPVDDIRVWAEFFESVDENRRVARTEISGTGVSVSTVFLGIDHGFGITSRPVLFETMVFGGPNDGWQDRYSTWAEAEAGHASTVQRLTRGETLWEAL